MRNLQDINFYGNIGDRIDWEGAQLHDVDENTLHVGDHVKGWFNSDEEERDDTFFGFADMAEKCGSTSHNMQVHRDDGKEGGGTHNAWFTMSYGVVVSTPVSEVPHSSTLNQPDDDVIEMWHTLIKEEVLPGVVAIANRELEKQGTEWQFQDEEIERLGEVLCAIIPFFNPFEVWAISEVLANALKFGHGLALVEALGITDHEEAGDVIQQALTGMDPDSLNRMDPSDKEKILKRVLAAEEVNDAAFEEDPVLAIMRRAQQNNN